MDKRREKPTLKTYLALSDDEQYELIDRVLTDAGIFDEQDRLRDDWQEILKHKGLA
jgi:hypothetical protein